MRCAHVNLLSYIVVLQFLLNATLWTTSAAISNVQDQNEIRRRNRPGEQAHSHMRGKRSQGVLHAHDRTSRKPRPKPKPSHLTSFRPSRAKHSRVTHSTPNVSQLVNDDGSGPATGPFLIPLLPYGLSNQILALKEALALAAVLNWTVVALGFWPHSAELAAAAGLVLKPGGKTNRGLLELDGVRMKVSEPTGTPGKSSHQHPHQLHLEASSVIPFDLVFDRKGLAPLVRIISREDAVRQYGWSQSGRADVLLSISPTSGLESTLEKAHQAELLDVRGAHVVRNHGFSCSTEGLSWLSRAAAGHRWIALYSYRRVVPAARSSYRVFRGDDSPCARAYHQVSLRLEKSPLITSTARNFVITALAHMQDGEGQGRPITEESTGGGGGGRITNSFPYYIALHVRPYPDTCLEYFVNMTTFDIDTASKVCTNPRLLLRMVPLVRQLLEARAAAAAAAAAATGTVWSPNGTWVLSSPSGSTLRAADAGARPPGADGAVFVMSHPRVREVLRRELRRLWDEADGASGRGGNGSSSPLPSPPPLASSPPPSLLRAPPLFFLDMSDLPVQLRTHVASTSLLSMVEQQMCLEAAVFIGTKVSSISVLVAQERSAKGEEGAVATAAHRAVEEARRGGDEEGRRGRGADDRGDGVDEGHPSVGQPGQGQDRADVGAEHLFFGVDTVLL